MSNVCERLLRVRPDLSTKPGLAESGLRQRVAIAKALAVDPAVLRRPTHPYTEMLLSSAPGPDWRPERVAAFQEIA